MLDTFDAAFYYGHNNHAYFFKGSKYIKYKPGEGVVRTESGILRTIGETGWESFPASFKEGINAALYYPIDGDWVVYFFKGNKYIKWIPEKGVEPSGGSAIRTVGVTGWKSFPDAFRDGIDAAFYYHDEEAAYFFRGSHYIKYLPGEGVEGGVRTIGETGWKGLPAAFRERIDAVFDYSDQDGEGDVTATRGTYFFRGRNYVKWLPNKGVDARYPRRIGLLHRDHGGWPGTSHLVAGPAAGPVETNSAKVWVWLSSPSDVHSLKVELNGEEHPFSASDPAGPIAEGGIGGIQSGSAIRVLTLKDLKPSTSYSATLRHGTTALDSLSFRTAPAQLTKGRVKIAFGSCARVNGTTPDVPAFHEMAEADPDIAIFCGDNCYYVNNDGRTAAGPGDWDSARRMFIRQLEVRNHPQMLKLARSVPVYATWDDHDFGPNNVDGAVHPELRQRATQVHNAMWPGGPANSEGNTGIYRAVRRGPVHIFLTDNRFYKNASKGDIWGDAQRVWLLTELEGSDAPVRVVVVSTQFLATSTEGHQQEAPDERKKFLDKFRGTKRPILILSGDVHYSELFRLDGDNPSWLVEHTSSPLRSADPHAPPPAKAGTRRIWEHEGEGFGLITVDVDDVDANGRVLGSITHELRDAAGVVRKKTTWNTALGIA